MTDDIVARLRKLDAINCMDSDHLHDGLVVDAADEIERLRAERDEAEPLLNELWERRTEATEMRAEIERLRKECSLLRQRVTMLAEAAAEDARRVCALEDIIRKKGAVL